MDQPTFTPTMLEQLAQDQGTIQFDYTFDPPPAGPPAVPQHLIDPHTASDLRAYVTLMPDGNLRFTRVRGDNDGGHIEIDVKPVIGKKTWTIFLVWSDTGPQVHVGADGQLLGG